MSGIHNAGAAGSSFLKPLSVLKQVAVERGMKVADFGCGHGYFSIPLGELVGPGGKVYAIDVVGNVLEAVRSRAAMAGVHNIETRRANVEMPGATKIGDAAVDMVLAANIFFQTKDKKGVLAEAHRVLKSGGALVVIDWEPGSHRLPAGLHLLSKEEGRDIAEKSAFKFEKFFDAGSHHWGLVLRKV